MLASEITVRAAQEITKGVRISTHWPLDSRSRPCFGRAQFEHTTEDKALQAINKTPSTQHPEKLRMQWVPSLRVPTENALLWRQDTGGFADHQGERDAR